MSINDIITSRFFACTPSRIWRIVKICDVVDRFPWKPFGFFLNIFWILGSMQLRRRAFSKLDKQTYTSEFESHWVPHSFSLVPHRSKEVCKLLDLGRYGCKGYTSVALGYSEVTLFRERENEHFVILSIVYWLYTLLCRSSMSSNCLVFRTSGGSSSSPALFLLLSFLCTESSSSCLNCPSLTSNWFLLFSWLVHT